MTANLPLTTKIDHYAKVLNGNKLFYLLLYGIFDNDRLSQRRLEETFNDSLFKVLFNHKRGNKHYIEILVDRPFRLIIVKSKSGEGKKYWLFTNELGLWAKEITQAYRRRWDIEVFFRFLNQKLTLSHLVSLNQNGLQVMLYMTLITSLPVSIYKKRE